jgi:hypothetical protein
MDNKIEDGAHSEEIKYDKKFVSRWADRCVEYRMKHGQDAANKWAKQMFSEDIIRLINKELARRYGNH